MLRLLRVTLHLADGSIVQGAEACGALSVATETRSIPLVPADICQLHRDNFEPARKPKASYMSRTDFEGFGFGPNLALPYVGVAAGKVEGFTCRC